MDLGNTSIHVINDGSFLVDGGAVFGQIPKAQWERRVKPDRRNRIRLGLTTLLIKTPEKNILIDTGAGSKRADKLKEAHGLNGNKLLRGLREYGLNARDIDIVILTHFHFDHSGGCTKLDRSGNAVPTFPRAEYKVQRSCLEAAKAPNERYEDSYYADDYLPLEQKGMLSLLDGDTEIIPGVTVKAAGGPSTGHQVVLIERGSERVAFASDLIPTHYHLPLAHIPAQDEHPNETLEQKREFLNMAVKGGWLIVFGHGSDDRAGYVEQRNGRLQFLPKEI